jgi:hypothetical protein
MNQVAVVTMNHPPVNALGIQFLEDFEKVLKHLWEGGESQFGLGVAVTLITMLGQTVLLQPQPFV